MFKLIVLSLFFTTQAYAAVWYYGTGEAVNLENQIGFENAQDIKLFTDGLVLSTSFDNGTTVQSLDRQIEVGELIPNNGFERADLAAVSCTNATTARVADVSGGQFNDWALQITATGTPWSCDIDGTASEGQGFLKALAIATVGGDASVCMLRDGVEDACSQNNIMTAVMSTYSIPVILGGTSNSVRIKGTSASNVVTLDRTSVKAGELASSDYSNEITITLVNSGTNNINGTMRVVRSGNLVAISGNNFFTHTSTDTPNSAAGVIPEWARPSVPQSNTYNASTTERRDFRVFTDGSVGFTYSANALNSGRAPLIVYPVAPEQASAVNGTVGASDLLVSESSVQTITTEATLTFGTVELIANGIFASNIFTVEQSGYYILEFDTYISRTTTATAAFALEAFFRVNGANLTTPCLRTMRYSDTNLASAADSAPRSSISCMSKRFLAKGDQVSVRMVSEQSVSVSRKVFALTRYMNPYGEPVNAVIDGYIQANRADLSQPKYCTIRQTSSTSTAAFASSEGCLNSGSRTASGIYEWTFLSGFFKSGTSLNCQCTATDPASNASLNCNFVNTANPVPETGTASVRIQNIGSNTTADRPFTITCTGAAP